MKRICKFCQKEIPQEAHKSRVFCSYECRSLFTKMKYEQFNPDTFRGKTSATTGAISELRVAVDLLAKGYDVFRALSPNCPCDLAILKGERLLRVEVRTTFISTAGKLYKAKNKRDDMNSIDVYAWVLPDKIIYEPALE